MPELRLKNQTFTLPHIDYKLGKALLAWAQSKRPDAYEPLARLGEHFKELPASVQKEFVQDMIKESRKPLTLESPFLWELLGSPDGAEFLFTTLFHRHHPGMTTEQVMEACHEANETYGEDYLPELLGVTKVPKPAPEEKPSTTWDPNSLSASATEPTA